PVVKLKAVMGKVELLREFSLTDRSNFTYPVLIGRNFLQGEFIVDVTRKNSTSPMSETSK
ncbi:MAG: RimK/LysX family protein, partial [Deltaproteobacteria bacterium]|nr:RimK/LysX family protein [Deltaproteobacteria bacterium]